MNLELCYTTGVQKPFYASGFLYHSPSQQILLQQLKQGDGVKFVLFRGSSRKGRDPKVVFQQCVQEALGISIRASSIRPVYDYIHDKLGEQFIFYVEVAKISSTARTSKNKAEWFSLSKLSKHAMSEQTRHDIIVGERVIRSLIDSARPPQSPRHH